MAITRTRQINLRLSDEELAAMQGAADAAGLEVSAWLRIVGCEVAAEHNLGAQLNTAIAIRARKVSRKRAVPK